MNTGELLNLVDALEQQPKRHRNDHILILDGLNALLRSFSVVTTVNAAGNHVGGLMGFLKSLNSIRRQFNPTRIIVAWDGVGGATNRKRLDPNYKATRAQAAVIHYDLYDTKKEEMDAVFLQGDRLIDYLACLPVTYVRLSKLEADDIIAYMALNAARGGKKVTIVSSDKDFLQLVSPNGIEVYNPTKKVLYDYKVATEFLEVLPENYNIVKALNGDISDNLPGIKGVGIKTLVKLFPSLQTDPDYSLDRLFDECSKLLDAKKICAKILADWHHVETNFKLMNLRETILSDSEKEAIFEIVKEPTPKLRIGPFLHMLEEDQIEGISKDPEGWLTEFNSLVL